MKKLIIFLAIILNAYVVDRVVASVDNLPITEYDVKTFMQTSGIDDYKKALNILIDKKVLENEVKKRGISVEDYEVEEALRKIAKKNGMTLFEFKSVLGDKLKDLKKQVRENLLKEKLFKSIVDTKLKIDDEEVKEYYKSHKNDFTVFKTIQVIKYSANNPKILERLKVNPLFKSNVKTKTLVFSYDEIPTNLMFLFKNTKVGEFTPIFNDGLSYSMFYVARKDGKVVLPFEKVKPMIYNILAQQKRNQILKNYFDKEKAQMKIEVYD